MEVSAEALGRILGRLQDIKPEECAPVLSSLLPRIVPLANNAQVREMVVAIITEALKRAKMYDCQLEMSVFDGLLGPEMLPFGCNFALVFLDTLDSLGRISGFNEASMASIVKGAHAHKLYSHQCNSLLFYAAKYSSWVPSAISMLPAFDRVHVSHFLGDYFVDFCLLERTAVTLNSTNLLSGGLSDARSERLLCKKKVLSLSALSSMRLALLELRCLPVEYGIAIALLCSSDSDKDVVSKSAHALNLLKDSGIVLSDQLPALSVLASLFFGLSDDGPHNILKKRTPMKAEHRLAFLKFAGDNFDGPNIAHLLSVLVSIVRKIFTETVQSVRDDMEGKQLQAALALLTRAIAQAQDVQSQHVHSFKVVAKELLQHWRMSSLYAQQGQDRSSGARGACYDALSAVAKGFPQLLAGDWEIAYILFAIAEPEANNSSAGSLFHALGKLRDAFQACERDRGMDRSSFFALAHSSKPSCRLAFIQWLEIMDDSPSEVLRNLAALADDKAEMVSKTANSQFLQYNDKAIATATAMGATQQQEFLHALIIGYVRSPSLAQASYSFNALSSRRSLFLYLKAIFEALVVVNEAGSIVPWTEELPEFLSAVLRNLNAEDLSAAKLEMKLMHVYVDDRYSTTACLQEDEDSKLPLIPATVVDYVCQITSLCLQLCREQPVLGVIRDKCSQMLLSRWLHLPTTMVRNMVGEVVTVLAKHGGPEELGQVFASCVAYISDTAALTDALFTNDHTRALYCASMVNLGARVAMQMTKEQSSDVGPMRRLLRDCGQLLERYPEEALPPSAAHCILCAEAVDAFGRLFACIQRARPGSFELAQLSAVTRLIKNREPFIVQAVCQAVMRVALVEPSADAAARAMLLADVAKSRLDRNVLFTLGECLVLATIARSPEAAAEVDLSCAWPVVLRSLSLVDRSQLCLDAVATSEQLLVAPEGKMLCAAYTLASIKALAGGHGGCPFDFFGRALAMGLNNLRSKDGFLQDLGCLTLCNLYELAAKHDSCADVPKAIQDRFLSLADYISHEVVQALTREGRSAQPVGFDSSGRGQQQRDEAATTTNSDVNHGADAERAAAVVDELLAAANRAAASELTAVLAGASLEHRDRATALAAAGERVTNEQKDSDYGVYSKVCTIAKKSGESAIIMMVLSLIKCDPTFGTDGTAVLARSYQPLPVVIEDSRVQSLLPMLFVAKCDPVSAVREVLKKVWTRLVALPEGAVMATYFDPIMKQVLETLLHPRWREREAACVALDALALNRPWASFRPYAPALLSKGFQVMDDLRESTRKAAAVFMKSLLSMVLNSCDSKSVSEEVVKQTVNTVLPILLDVGIVSPSVEARGFSLGAILKVVQQAQHHLSPWLMRLVDILLESSSALEPQMMQYMQFHVQTMKVSAEQWESHRMQLAQHSPVHDAIQHCLDLVTYQNIAAISATIYRHLSEGVGLLTRVAAADAFSFLVEKQPTGMERCGIQAFKLICKTLFDHPTMSSSLRKAMSNALGMLAKVVHAESLGDELAVMMSRYQRCTGQDLDLSVALASAAQQVVRKAGDRVTDPDVISCLLGIAYIGSCDRDAPVQALWSETFAMALEKMNVGTKLAALRQGLDVIALGVVGLAQSLSWDRRKQALAIVDDLLKSLQWTDLAGVAAPMMAALLCTLRPSAWQGQEQVLEGLAAFVAKADTQFQFDLPDLALELTTPKGITISILLDSIDDFQASGCVAVQDQLRECFATTDSTPRVPLWKVGPQAFVRLFAHECRRKDADYRFSAARALSLVPWARLLPHMAPSSYIAEFVSLACLTARSRDGPPVAARITAPQPPLNTTSSVRASMGNSALFGSRYGQIAVRPLKRSAPIQLVKPPSSDIAMDVDSSASPVGTRPAPSDLVAGRDSSVAPAFRMFLLEAIAGAWPSSCDPDLLASLLLWAEDCVREEVWSVRRATVALLAEVCMRSALGDEHLASVIRLLQTSFQEPKWVKVKLAVLDALRVAMKGPNRAALQQHHKEDIRAIVREATADPQPLILEAAAALQTLLLTF